MKKLQVTLKRSPIGIPREQRQHLVGLGLRKPRQVKVLENTPAVRGLIKKVIHMVDVVEVES